MVRGALFYSRSVSALTPLALAGKIGMKPQLLNQRRARRAGRVRAKLTGTSERPRLAVFRSHVAIYAQVIDDLAGKTLAAASSREVDAKGNKSGQAVLVGELLAKKAGEKGISAVVFDRRGYAYHGRVKALADGARKGGLKF